MPEELVIADLDSGALDHYDPGKGLKKIAVAEAAEKYFRRAKDADGLMKAVTAKLTQQRIFVLWWEKQDKNKGGRPLEKNPLQTSKELTLTLRDHGLDYITVHRWRSRFKDEVKFTKALEAALDRCIRVCEANKGSTAQRGASGTNDNEWYTPAAYIEAAREVLGEIDLDPASNSHAQDWIKATHFLTREDDALQHEWPGRVWLNPPYMQPDIQNFVEKLVGEVQAGRTTEAILLTHNYTDTAWFHLAASACAAICFTRGRVRFIDSDGVEASPTQGQAFFYYGDKDSAFHSVFTSIGFVVKPC